MARRRDEKRKRMTSFHYDNHPFIHPSIHLPMHLQMAGRREEKRRKRDDYFHYDNHPSIHLCIFKWPFGRREWPCWAGLLSSDPVINPVINNLPAGY